MLWFVSYQNSFSEWESPCPQGYSNWTMDCFSRVVSLFLTESVCLFPVIVFFCLYSVRRGTACQKLCLVEFSCFVDSLSWFGFVLMGWISMSLWSSRYVHLVFRSDLHTLLMMLLVVLTLWWFRRYVSYPCRVQQIQAQMLCSLLSLEAIVDHFSIWMLAWKTNLFALCWQCIFVSCSTCWPDFCVQYWILYRVSIWMDRISCFTCYVLFFSWCNFFFNSFIMMLDIIIFWHSTPNLWNIYCLTLWIHQHVCINDLVSQQELSVS